MAHNLFLVLIDQHGSALPGETQDQYFAKFKAIEIASFSFGIHNTATIGSGSGGPGAGKVQFMQLAVSKMVDSVSPDLLNEVANGTHLRQADLYVRKAGSNQDSPYFLKYSFRLVYVTDIQWSGADSSVTEEVTFSYGALQISYTPTTATGSTGAISSGGWNQVSNNGNFNDPGLLK